LCYLAIFVWEIDVMRSDREEWSRTFFAVEILALSIHDAFITVLEVASFALATREEGSGSLTTVREGSRGRA